MDKSLQALDNILEEIIKLTPKVVRIGSRSISEALEKHNLSSIRRAVAVDRVRDPSYYKRQKELEKELNEIEACLKNCEEVEVFALLEMAAKTSSVLDDLHALESADLLKGADVIGMTTTGAAKNRKLVQLVGCEVVLMEEAGQVKFTLLLKYN